MSDLIFATHNNHKLFEVKKILPNKFDLISLNDIGIHDDIPETQNTLQGNAEQKADYVYERTKQNVFADDTGLEIEALNMEPGVFSARYAGEKASFEDNMQKVLENMQNIENRNAQFRTVICLILDGQKHFFEGKVKGKILTEKQGVEGFGYDPIFVPENYNISFAEMPIEEKNKISHRGRAMAKLNDFLLSI